MHLLTHQFVERLPVYEAKDHCVELSGCAVEIRVLAVVCGISTGYKPFGLVAYTTTVIKERLPWTYLLYNHLVLRSITAARAGTAASIHIWSCQRAPTRLVLARRATNGTRRPNCCARDR